MYRDWIRAYDVANALNEQVLPENIELEVLIVDDGTNEPSPILPSQQKNLRLLQLPENLGRAGARNAGANASKGHYLLFIDCDCLPVGKNFLASHLQSLCTGAIASIGHVKGTSGDFWDHYQQLASHRRKKQYIRGYSWIGSSQNLAVIRSAFEQAGGFNERYRHYGFEDRDLLIRLNAYGRIIWTNDAYVAHSDSLSLHTVAQKMYEGAQQSAYLFSKEHPHAYEVLGYASLDTRLHPWLRIPANIIGPISLKTSAALDRLIPWLPFNIAALLVKITTACAFMYGSVKKYHNEPY